MAEYRHVGQEVWIREAAQCIVLPSVNIVLQGNDGHSYLVRLVDVGESLSVELGYLDNGLVSFEQNDDRLPPPQNT
jgi:hypothetical protein